MAIRAPDGANNCKYWALEQCLQCMQCKYFSLIFCMHDWMAINAQCACCRESPPGTRWYHQPVFIFEKNKDRK